MRHEPPLLPLEITDSIIDEVDQFMDLHARVVTLCSCALVCRRWRSRARRRLFDVVAFNSGERRLYAFRNLLSSPHCTILSSVRLIQAEMRGREVLLPGILSDLSVLRDLTTFDLSAASFRRIPLDSECFANYRSLTTLVLTACTFSTCRDACRIIGGCLGLESLTLSSCTLGDGSSHASKPHTPPPPRLKHLVVENSEPKKCFLSWLCTGESSLEDLRVRTIKSGDLLAINALACHASPKLVHLTIGLDTSSNADAILGSEELTCASLRSLTLDNVPPRAAHNVVTFLAGMKCRHVEELTLAFGTADLSSNKIIFFPWMQLAVVLEQPGFGSLERLCISGWCSPSEKLVVGEALKRLRTRRGPLEIAWK